MKHASHSRWPIVLAILTASIGIGLSLYTRSRVAQAEATAARLTAETLRLNTEQELIQFVEVLESVRALHAFSDAVDQAAMNEFIEKGLIHQHDVLGAFGLAQRISPHVRSLLEKEAAEQGTGYRVLKKGPSDTWVPSESKPAYYPLTWQNKKKGLDLPIGFDFSSIGEAYQTIKKIEQTRRTTLVGEDLRGLMLEALGLRENRFKSQTPSLKPTVAPSSSHWVFAPVLPRCGPNTVIGFAVATLDLETVLNRVASRSSLSPKLRLTLLATPNTKETIRFTNGAWFYRHPLNAIDTQWLFECSLPVNVTSRRRSLITLAAGLIITALMTSQLLILGGRTRKIEDKVRARTEDLRVANVHLEENLRERAHMEEEMNELAARERRRIGRDLHDSLGQKLTGAVFLSRSLLDYFSKSQKPEDQRSTQQPAPQQTHAKTLNETLKSAVAQVRNMARGLAPVALNDESLGEALQHLSEEMTALYDVSCEITERASLPALKKKTKYQLYLIAREAVNNAARHAQAQRIKIRLTGNEIEWTLRIEDDGKGLPPTPLSPGMGIRIMRHRASLIGATFNLNSAPDEGTCISVGSQTS